MSKDEQPGGSLGFVRPPNIQIESEAFTGSLAMLFECVRSRKVDLQGVPLGPVCTAYFAYIRGTDELDIEAAATGMTALSYLLERKAWHLIPTPEDDEPEGDDLLDEIEPWAGDFQPAMEALTERKHERESLFFRHPESDAQRYELPISAGEATSDDLASALERLLARATKPEIPTVETPKRTLAEQMQIVMATLKPEPESLDTLIPGPITKLDAVWWFLALLELIRLAQARVVMQNGEPLFARAS